MTSVRPQCPAFSCDARSAFKLKEKDYLKDMLSSRQLQGFVGFPRSCQRFLAKRFGAKLIRCASFPINRATHPLEVRRDS